MGEVVPRSPCRLDDEVPSALCTPRVTGRRSAVAGSVGGPTVGCEQAPWRSWEACVVESPPTGTVTFLFTDIEGSTRLWQDEPEAMRALLVEHDAILRDVDRKSVV